PATAGPHDAAAVPLAAPADTRAPGEPASTALASTDPAGAASRPAADADADLAGAADAPPSSFLGFVREGVHHILIGYDHILFLLSLLLPAVWIRSAVRDPRTGRQHTRWLPANDLRRALGNVLKV